MKRLALFAITSLAAASASLLIPALADAAEAYFTTSITLRAGPDPGYPLIAQIPAGTIVDVQGCTDGWEWCDVIVDDDRGWVAGNFIEYEYQDQPVLLPVYAVRIGIPVVSFVIVDYWDQYYRDRPFYRDRDRWYAHPLARRPPPPPVSHPFRGRPEPGNEHRRQPPRELRESRPVPQDQDIGQREPTSRGHAVDVERAPPQRGSEPATHPASQRPVQGQPPAHGRSQGKPGKPAQHGNDRDDRDHDDGH